jgi:hypothetical protein
LAARQRTPVPVAALQHAPMVAPVNKAVSQLI